jgi:hypothetical protein
LRSAERRIPGRYDVDPPAWPVLQVRLSVHNLLDVQVFPQKLETGLATSLAAKAAAFSSSAVAALELEQQSLLDA